MPEQQEEPLDLSLRQSDLTDELKQAFVDYYTQYLNDNLLQFVTQLIAFHHSTSDAIPQGSIEEETEEGGKSRRKEKTRRKEKICKKRSEANARERNRVQQLSKMFDNLRICLPLIDDIKISKLATLKIATSYIGFLASILDGNEKNQLKYDERLTAEIDAIKLMRK